MINFLTKINSYHDVKKISRWKIMKIGLKINFSLQWNDLASKKIIISTKKNLGRCGNTETFNR